MERYAIKNTFTGKSPVSEINVKGHTFKVQRQQAYVSCYHVSGETYNAHKYLWVVLDDTEQYLLEGYITTRVNYMGATTIPHATKKSLVEYLEESDLEFLKKVQAWINEKEAE